MTTLVNVKRHQCKTLKHEDEDGRPLKSYYCIKISQELYGDKFVYIGRAVQPPHYYIQNEEKYIYTHRLQLTEAETEKPIADSKWHNPYRIGKDGTREVVIKKFVEYLRCKPELIESLYELQGDKILGCYCFPQPCHGNVLIDILDGNSEKYGIRKESFMYR